MTSSFRRHCPTLLFCQKSLPSPLRQRMEGSSGHCNLFSNGTTLVSEGENAWPQGVGGASLFRKGVLESDIRARGSHEGPQLWRNNKSALHRTTEPHCQFQGSLRFSQSVPLQFPLFSKPVACTVESSSFALYTSCIFKQQFLRTDALFPPSWWPFCTNSRLPASVILIEGRRETC